MLNSSQNHVISRDGPFHAKPPAPLGCAENWGRSPICRFERRPRPSCRGLRSAIRRSARTAQPDDLTAPLRIRGDSDYSRHRHDPTALARFKIGGVEPDIEPVATPPVIRHCSEPKAHNGSFLAQLRNCAFEMPLRPNGIQQPHQGIYRSTRPICQMSHICPKDTNPFRRLSGAFQGEF